MSEETLRFFEARSRGNKGDYVCGFPNTCAKQHWVTCFLELELQIQEHVKGFCLAPETPTDLPYECCFIICKPQPQGNISEPLLVLIALGHQSPLLHHLEHGSLAGAADSPSDTTGIEGFLGGRSHYKLYRLTHKTLET